MKFKYNLLALTCLLIIQKDTLQAQTTKNKTADQIKGNQKFQKVAEECKTYNQNVIANQFLQDEATRIVTHKRQYTEFTSKLIKTGKKDPAGNEILHVALYLKDVLTYYLLPDFEDYPLHYLWYDCSPELVSNPKTGERRNFCRSTSLIPTSGQSFMYNHDNNIEITNSKKSMDYDGGVSTCLFAFKKYGMAAGEQEQANRNVERFKNDWFATWNAADAWNTRMLKKAEEKTYDELIKEFVVGDAFLLRSGLMDSCKVSFKNDAAGKVEEITFQFPFIDNKYYDKEKFYVKAVKNKNGFFEIKNTQPDLAIKDGSVIIPLEGRLFLTYYDYGHKAYTIRQCISTIFYDAMYRSIFAENRIFGIANTEEETINESDEEYGVWWKRKYLETSYDSSKDLILFSNFFTKYASTFKM